MAVTSWLIILVLLLVLIVLGTMLLLMHWDIRMMAKQLEDIHEHAGTNELVRTNTHNRSLSRFAAKINQLILLSKQNQQAVEKRELELKQEITNISHDLRTPLTSIKGFSELLTDSSIPETERKEYLAIIQKKIDHLTAIVDLFYELSQLDSSDKKLVMEKQSLNQTAGETMLIFHDEFEKKQIRVNFDESPISHVFADHQATVRIVSNIMQNALTYAKSYLTVSFAEEEDYICLRAANDVENINGTELQKIFNRTYRLDPSRTGSRLGLGLHIVQQLVEKQGGRVAAHIRDHEFMIEVKFRKWQ